MDRGRPRPAFRVFALQLYLVLTLPMAEARGFSLQPRLLPTAEVLGRVHERFYSRRAPPRGISLRSRSTWPAWFSQGHAEHTRTDKGLEQPRYPQFFNRLISPQVSGLRRSWVSERLLRSIGLSGFPQGLPYGRQQFGVIHRLFEEGLCTSLHGPHPVFVTGSSGNDDNGN
jgi:hypothetical protein